jgi:hypothetical protein
MNSNTLIIREYLSSLKEDKELDYLFPLLLNLMGFRIVQTAKEAKGQSQYGKDIIAIGKDKYGKTYRWYFELKGYKDKDITDKNYSAQDGIRESIIEAKDTAFNDSSIPEFNHLSTKIVLVHNGVIKPNIRQTFEGFISKEFQNDEFERWDIYYLTDLFSKHLFNEYLFIDDESNRLFKRILAFLDVPDNNFDDFKKLVQLQFDKLKEIKGRALTKLFSTLGLLLSMIFHYSKENDFLVPAKETSKFLIIFTWKWILNNKHENKKSIIKEFDKLLKIQLNIFNVYLKKTFPVAKIENGLFAKNGAFYEKVGYPLRSFQYIDDIIYYCRLRQHFSTRKGLIKLKNKQKDLIIELINNNSGFKRPILDNHSIPMMQLFLFFTDSIAMRQKDVDFIYNYIFEIVQNLKIEKYKNNRLPELYNNLDLVIEYFATGEKPEEYTDSSSILIAILLELSVIFDAKPLFDEILSFIDNDLSLQIPNIDFNSYNVEELLFEKNLQSEYYVETIDRINNNLVSLKKESNFDKFKETVREKIISQYEFRTDKKGFKFIRYLAHSYYMNEILSNEWRILITK